MTPTEQARAVVEALEAEANEMMARKASSITAGEPDEKPVREWEANGVIVRELPVRDVDDVLGLVRISVGGNVDMGYCVFRGSLAETKNTLRRALNALNISR